MDDREAQPTALCEHPPCFVDRAVQVVDILQRHECDDAVEARVGERQRRDRRTHERHLVSPHIPELVLLHVEADCVVEALQDDARSAADVEDAATAAGEIRNDAVAAALPISLQRDLAVESALIVVRTESSVLEDLPPPDMAITFTRGKSFLSR